MKTISSPLYSKDHCAFTVVYVYMFGKVHEAFTWSAAKKHKISLAASNGCLVDVALSAAARP